MGRAQLVKFFIQGMLFHTFYVYDWPSSLRKELDRCICNFIWSGDNLKRKLVTVSWRKVCSSLDVGVLGICPLNKY